MPVGTPPPDVRFDHQAAAHALAELHRTLRSIDDIVDGVETAWGRAQIHWRGATRDHVERAWNRHRANLREGADELRLLARELGAAIDVAHTEQHRRELARARWEHESGAETLVP